MGYMDSIFLKILTFETSTIKPPHLDKVGTDGYAMEEIISKNNYVVSR